MRRGRRSLVGAALLAVWSFASALVIGLLFLPVMLAPRKVALFPMRLWARGMILALRLLVGARVEIRGRENLPTTGCLVAAKHQGMIDIIIAVLALRDPCIILKKQLMRIPIFGWYAWKSGMIPIDRKGGAVTLRAMNHATASALAQGRQVLIYPEGTRTEPGAPPAYKGGVGVLYRDLQAVCAPMASNSGLVWPAHGLAKYSGLAVFEFLPPIPPGLSRHAFMARLEQEIETTSNVLLEAS
ncbi:1-acyl-sn-glycerol-3-phosphate acyltransferase [Caulobacter sp. S45]|jgi:1-acyl-sn-glycerol-3-phosphate acyltransferase|uniref:lysophospholipid acyltransferase family protein n=1 Tax=Caulobacter sp. S45 TaxID=1641861 RepID=UPI00131DF1FE|nr:lysophospholipid acyltransferase family protein [Caulobacter sp. S45]